MKLALTFVVCGVLASLAVAADDGLTVQLKSGTIHGAAGKNARKFLGVPFASPPVGDLRWKAPTPPASWDGVLETVKDMPTCVQGSDAFTLFQNVSEDCLYLDLYAPAANTTRVPPAGGWPVMIFFFGGSWKYGSNNFLIYDGMFDVDDVEDVIIITANYRLQAFGFLASKALASEDASGSTGNYGIQDQRMSMVWARENAAAFGGNPNNVMIFGESAGAGSVSNHLVMPKSKGLYQRAAMESGPIAPWTAQPLNISALKYDSMLTNAGCVNSDPKAALACMRALDTKAVLDASSHNLNAGFLEWSPVVDGVELTAMPEELAAAGKFNRVPTLLGTNKNEGTLFVKESMASDYDTMVKTLQAMFGDVDAARVLKMYPIDNYKSPWWCLTYIFGDAMMSCPARRTARWINSGPDAAPAFLYYFSHELEVISIVDLFKKPPLGVCHASELPFVWNFDLALIGKGEPTLALQFVSYWTQFAASGNPSTPYPNSGRANGQGAKGVVIPHWPAYNMTNDANIILDIPVGVQSHLKEAACDMWDTIPVPPRVVFDDPNV